MGWLSEQNEKRKKVTDKVTDKAKGLPSYKNFRNLGMFDPDRQKAAALAAGGIWAKGAMGGAGAASGTSAATTGAASKGVMGLTGKQLLGGAAMIGSNWYAGKKAGEAADTQAAAYDRATQAQVDMFNQGQKATAPWRQSGSKALTQYEKLMGLRGGGSQEKAFEDFRNTPGYQFQQDEMMRMLEGTSAAGGTFGSGQMAKDLMKYGGNLADQNYGSYMDRLQNMSTVGSNAATNSASQMQALGKNMGQNAIGAGQAQAAGQINQANLMTNLMNQGAQAYGMYGSRPPSPTQSTSFTSQPPSSVGANISNDLYGNQSYGGYQMPQPSY
jgi:hypothetical protein